MSQPVYVHLVDRSPSRRAYFAREILRHRLHVEIYDSVDELCSLPSIRDASNPRQGAILLSDDEAIDVPGTIRSLLGMHCYLPVIAYSSEQPSSRRIVTAIKGGAIDYMCFPGDLPGLGDRIQNLIEVSRQLALRYQRRAEALDRIARLTVREREVLRSTIEGCTSKETAEQLGLSPRTVEVHRASILHKLGVSTSAAAISIGLAAGLVEIGPGFGEDLLRAA